MSRKPSRDANSFVRVLRLLFPVQDRTLARRLGIDQKTFNKIINGKQPGSLEVFEKMASLFNELLEEHNVQLHNGDRPLTADDLSVSVIGTVNRMIDLYGKFGKEVLGMVAEDFHPELCWECSGEGHLPFGGTYRGIAGLRRFFKKFFDVLEGPPKSLTVAWCGEIGNTVVVVGQAAYRINEAWKRSNKDCDLLFVNLFEFKEGKLIRYLNLFDTAAMSALLRKKPRRAKRRLVHPVPVGWSSSNGNHERMRRPK